MPNRYKYIIALLLLALAAAQYGCKQKSNKEHVEHEQQQSVYTCPMHPEIIKK